MKKFLFIFCIFGILNAEDSAYFLSQKKALERKIEELDEAKQALESYKAAFLAVQKEKEEKNQTMLENIQKERKTLFEIRKNNAEILAETRKLRAEIIERKISKVSETFAKMKDASAAAIFETMDEKDTIKILLSLEAKKISAILSKMTPETAAKLAIALSDAKKIN